MINGRKEKSNEFQANIRVGNPLSQAGVCEIDTTAAPAAGANAVLIPERLEFGAVDTRTIASQYHSLCLNWRSCLSRHNRSIWFQPRFRLNR
jgi:hypothetical protein